MLKIINSTLIKFFISVIFFIGFVINTSYANLIKDFKISGNERISNQTIKLFSGYKVNDEIDNSKLNEIIKNLYETNFFKNISINFENNILYINVSENPLIQSIIFIFRI